MGIFKKIKSKIEEANDDEIEIRQAKDPKEYSVFDRMAVPFPKLVAPEPLSAREDYCKVGDAYTKTLYIHTYPPSVDDNFLRDILGFKHAIDLSIYIHPIPIKPFLNRLKQKVYRDDVTIEKKKEGGILPDAQQEMQLNDNQLLIQGLEQNLTRPYSVMVSMTIRADSVDELRKVTETLERQLTAINTRQTAHRHKQGFLTNLPLMDNKLRDAKLGASRSMHTQAVMTMFPFTAADLTHDSGVMIGVSRITGTPIIFNRFLQPQLENPNMAIFGAPGSGKSFFSKQEQLRLNYRDIPVIVLDPSGEYVDLCEGLGGSVVDMSLQSENLVNPLDFSNAVRPGFNALTEKIAFMVEMLRLMVRTEGGGGLTIDAMTKQIFENALIEAYRIRGYDLNNVETQAHAIPENMPLFSDVWHVLNEVARSDPDPEMQSRARPLLAALSSFVGDGHLAPMFDRHTNVNLNTHFLCFDYSNLAPQHRSLGMYLVLEYLRTTYLTKEGMESGIKRAIYIDEAHVLMDHPEIAQFLDWTFRTSRKYGVGMTVITQNVGVFAHGTGGDENKAGRGILASCATRVLFKQEASEISHAKQEFRMNQAQWQSILGAGLGEGLLYMGNDVTWFSSMNMSSDLEYRLLTTTASEKAEIAQEKRALQAPPQAPPHQLEQSAPAQPIPVLPEPYSQPAPALPPHQQGEIPAQTRMPNSEPQSNLEQAFPQQPQQAPQAFPQQAQSQQAQQQPKPQPQQPEFADADEADFTDEAFGDAWDN